MRERPNWRSESSKLTSVGRTASNSRIRLFSIDVVELPKASVRLQPCRMLIYHTWSADSWRDRAGSLHFGQPVRSSTNCIYSVRLSHDGQIDLQSVTIQHSIQQPNNNLSNWWMSQTSSWSAVASFGWISRASYRAFDNNFSWMGMTGAPAASHDTSADCCSAFVQQVAVGQFVPSRVIFLTWI